MDTCYAGQDKTTSVCNCKLTGPLVGLSTTLTSVSWFESKLSNKHVYPSSVGIVHLDLGISLSLSILTAIFQVDLS